jgi:protein involved in ribonucleotide reduction
MFWNVFYLHKCCSVVASGNRNFHYVGNAINIHACNLFSPSVMGFVFLVQLEMGGVLVVAIITNVF